MTALDPIPYEDYGGDGPWLHFAHANGYPPGTYRPLFDRLCRQFQVVAMRQRPLWPGSDPHTLSDWRPLAADLERFLDERGLTQVVGAGHSFGATSTLRLALRCPERFSALLLIDPVLFPPRRIFLWRLLYRLGLGYRVHPLVKGARRRRSTFESKAAMYANYRSKTVFSRLSDEALQAYVDALGCEDEDGRVTLCYPAEWEARIYVTNMRADMELWRALPSLRVPLLIVYGLESDTFGEETARRVQHLLPAARLVPIPSAGHLVPMEKPEEVYDAMTKFMNSLIDPIREHPER